MNLSIYVYIIEKYSVSHKSAIVEVDKYMNKPKMQHKNT